MPEIKEKYSNKQSTVKQREAKTKEILSIYQIVCSDLIDERVAAKDEL